MKILRTPDERFQDLPDFPFEPHYAELADGLRLHYLDEGPSGTGPVLLMHGEPTWSYLYRKMIPGLVAAGHRCVVPDLIGFGRSDKPAEQDDYTYQRHVDWMAEALFDRLGLSGITLFAQDWGGLIGLRLVALAPDRFDRVVAAYDAPFPDDSFRAGARRFPSLVPTSVDDPAHQANTETWEVLRRYERPFLCAYSDGDPITRGTERQFIGHVPGTAGQAHRVIEGAGHFLQEDKGPELATLVSQFMAG